jgi:hypothetical protein
METLSLEQIYYLGQIIAAGAVVITLIYVGLQVKQNTHAVNLATAHNVSESLRDSQALIVQNEGMCDIWLRGMRDTDSLSGNDKLRFYTYMHNFFGLFEDAYYSWQKGALDPRLWDSIYRRFLVLKSLPGWQSYWSDRKFFYHVDFVHYVDEVLLPAEVPAGYKFPGT